jgi:hypothetical protein
MSKRRLAEFAKGIHGSASGENTNTPPIAAGAASRTVAGLTVTFRDNSTDLEDPQYDLRISVSWGDGTIDRGLPGSTFEHTYRSAGAKTIRHTATDTRGRRGYEKVR